MQFSAVPMNLICRKPSRRGVYLITGKWGILAEEDMAVAQNLMDDAEIVLRGAYAFQELATHQDLLLGDDDFVALFIDGKTFADEEMVIALGVTIDGQKVPLGFVETGHKVVGVFATALGLVGSVGRHRRHPSHGW